MPTTHRIDGTRSPGRNLMLAWPTNGGPDDALVCAIADHLEAAMTADKNLRTVTITVEVTRQEPQSTTAAADPMSPASPVSAR